MLTQDLPKWNNTDEYPQIDSKEFQADLLFVEECTANIQSIFQTLVSELSQPELALSQNSVEAVQKSLQYYSDLYRVFYNLNTYIHCEIALDAKNTEAHKIESKLSQLRANFEIAINPLNSYISKTTEDNFEKIMNSDQTKDYRFYFEQIRTQKDFLLSDAEENLISNLKISGHLAWGNLYNSIAGTSKVHVHLPDGAQDISIAQAANLTRSADATTRKAAWVGIQNTWSQHKESVAAILNALAGWRLDINLKRSQIKKLDFLDTPLYQNRISQNTLDAMLAAIDSNKTRIQSALKTMAHFRQQDQLHPWDLSAPAPIQNHQTISYQDGLQLVQDSFAAMDPVMGEFVKMMNQKNWIDASQRPNKSQGAFCTGFMKSGNPRVFMTYGGSEQDVSTLAHELGHGYHSWVLKDLSPIAGEYPMTLAETASIFSENLLFEYQIKNAKTKDELLSVYWSIAEGAIGLLLNIPTRFEFEKNFYEKRKNGYVSADELSALMKQAFKNWYGDSLSQVDELFWASKLHFSIAEVSFYNFPYTFGYLFSLSLFARKNEWGSQFSEKYKAILRDTGLMTAEDLIQKHLNEDITKKEFWQKSLDIVIEKIDEFNKLSH